MNRPKPPGRLHTGAKIQDVTPGALRAAEILATTQRKPSRKLVLESAMIIDRETDLPQLLAVLSDALATLRNWPAGSYLPGSVQESIVVETQLACVAALNRSKR